MNETERLRERVEKLEKALTTLAAYLAMELGASNAQAIIDMIEPPD